MDYIRTLEDKISGYFEADLRDFQERNHMTLNESLEAWSDRYSAIYNTPSYMNEFIESILKPEFGIDYVTFQECLRSSGTTFMKYVESLMRARLNEGNIFGTEENSESDNKEKAEEIKTSAVEKAIGADEGSLDNLDDESIDTLLGSIDTGDEDIEADVNDSDDVEKKANTKKSSIIKKILGDSKVDLSDEDSDELDSILGRLASSVKIFEKVSIIKESFKDEDISVLEKLVSKTTGMTLDESRTALELMND